MPSQFHSLHPLHPLQLTGRTTTHVTLLPEHNTSLHHQTAKAFSALSQAALEHGFCIKIISGFRDIHRQLTLWNRKMTGASPILDTQGQIIDIHSLNIEQRVRATLAWLALPSTSRHHWGTDIDIIDTAAISPDYKIQLNPQEFSKEGPFGPLTTWLHENARQYDFFFPYLGTNGGVSYEPWHISYQPLADVYTEALSLEMVREAVSEIDIQGKAYILENLENIFNQFTKNITRSHFDKNLF